MLSERERYAARAAQRKTDFTITVAMYVGILAAAIVAIILMRENTVGVIVCIACLVAMIVKLVYTLRKFPTLKVLFAKELEGEIVDIHVVDVPAVRGMGGRPKRMPRVRNTRGASWDGGRRWLKGELYIKTDDGNISFITGMTKEATDVYCEGDRVLRIAGTKYPVIMSRDPHKIPCPICGTVHSASEVKCPHCGA